LKGRLNKEPIIYKCIASNVIVAGRPEAEAEPLVAVEIVVRNGIAVGNHKVEAV